MNSYILIITDRNGLHTDAVGPMDYDTHIRIGTDATQAGKHVTGHLVIDAALYHITSEV